MGTIFIDWSRAGEIKSISGGEKLYYQNLQARKHKAYLKDLTNPV